MPARVIDCNVLAAASGYASHQTDECQAASADALRVAAKGLIVLDEAGVILGAYRAMGTSDGQPGPGELFYRWAINVRGDRRHCKLVELATNADGQYSSYPTDPEFQAFDDDDHVYIAAAMASGLRPEIINATDSDWLDVVHALDRHGIRVRNVCQLLSSRT